MSVKYALMALLAHAEKPASALQAEYLAAMEHTQTLNIGQVSQTLSRLGSAAGTCRGRRATT